MMAKKRKYWTATRDYGVVNGVRVTAVDMRHTDPEWDLRHSLHGANCLGCGGVISSRPGAVLEMRRDRLMRGAICMDCANRGDREIDRIVSRTVASVSVALLNPYGGVQ